MPMMNITFHYYFHCYYTSFKVAKLRQAFGNDSSANMKLSKIPLHKIGQSEGFLGKLLVQLIKTGLPLIENVLKPLAKSVLISLGLTAAVSRIDPAFHKKSLDLTLMKK